MTKTKIHFVCTGNTFRSRLAKAYLDSLKCDGIETSSSGVEATKNLNGIICWYTQKLITQNGLKFYEEATWTQTTETILNDADYIIFMQTHHLIDCQKNFNYHSTNYEIWEISDMSEDKREDLERIQESREVFEKIKQKVDELAKRLNNRQ